MEEDYKLISGEEIRDIITEPADIIYSDPIGKYLVDMSTHSQS